MMSTGSSGIFAHATGSSTSGVLIQKGTSKYLTVASYGFPNTDEVFHPGHTGEKIGDMVDWYPELDLAMVKFTPANDRFANFKYPSTESPRRLVEGQDLE